MRAGRLGSASKVVVEEVLVGERRRVLRLRRKIKSLGEKESAEAGLDDLILGEKSARCAENGRMADSREGCNSTWR